MTDDLRPDAPATPTRRVSVVPLVALEVLALFCASLVFAPVRTMASQLLSVFRVSNLATVSITSDDLQKISTALDKGDPHISLSDLGDVWVDGKPPRGSSEPTPTTLAQAAAQVDFALEVPTSVAGTQSVLIQPGYDVKFKLNIAKVNSLLRYYGADKVFSDSLDGKTFEIKTHPVVYLTYGKKPIKFVPTGGSDMMDEDAESAGQTLDPTSQDVFIAQSRGPELIVPDGVNPLEIRDVVLGLPFLPENLRSQLSSISDWQNTLLIPNLSGSTRDITVNGNPGVVISTPTGPDTPPNMVDQNPVAVMWHNDGVLRAVATTNEKRSLSIAESMAR